MMVQSANDINPDPDPSARIRSHSGVRNQSYVQSFSAPQVDRRYVGHNSDVRHNTPDPPFPTPSQSQTNDIYSMPQGEVSRSPSIAPSSPHSKQPQATTGRVPPSPSPSADSPLHGLLNHLDEEPLYTPNTPGHLKSSRPNQSYNGHQQGTEQRGVDEYNSTPNGQQRVFNMEPAIQPEHNAGRCKGPTGQHSRHTQVRPPPNPSPLISSSNQHSAETPLKPSPKSHRRKKNGRGGSGNAAVRTASNNPTPVQRKKARKKPSATPPPTPPPSTPPSSTPPTPPPPVELRPPPVGRQDVGNDDFIPLLLQVLRNQSTLLGDVKQLMVVVKDTLLDMKSRQEDLVTFVSKLRTEGPLSAELIAKAVKESSDKTLTGIFKCIDAIRHEGADTASNKKLKTVRIHTSLVQFPFYQIFFHSLCIPNDN